MNIADLIKNFGGCTKFAARFGITRRTATNWQNGSVKLAPEQVQLYALVWDCVRDDLPNRDKACRRQFLRVVKGMEDYTILKEAGG